jgi:FkbM family methyltransferase
MLTLFTKLMNPSKKYRRRFGQIAGFWLWFNLRKHLKRTKGTWHEVRVPGLTQPVILRAGTSDVLTFIQLLVDGELDFQMTKEPATIVDAGANIGLASLYFTHRFPKAKILALEVDQANYDLLVSNTKAYPNITCLKTALWSKRAQLNILNPTDEPWAFRVGEVASASGTSVPALGMHDLLDQFKLDRIDLLKVDIEGAEKEVFQNGTDKWIDRIEVIAVELHDHIAPGASQSLHEALRGRRHQASTSGEYTIIRLEDPVTGCHAGRNVCTT